MSEARRAYLKATGLLPINKREARLAALERAHDIRKFEIELYWKRATYFWVLQAAVFAAFGLIWKDSDPEKWSLITVALSCLGALTALSGWLAAKGSKFWQGNWEFHIDLLEDEFEGKLHKTVRLGRLGARWSVSGVNDRLLLCFLCFWLALIWIATDHALKGKWWSGFGVEFIDSTRTALAIIIAATAVAAGSLILRISVLRGEFTEDFSVEYSKQVQKWPRFWRGKNKTRILMRPEIK